MVISALAALMCGVIGGAILLAEILEGPITIVSPILFLLCIIFMGILLEED